MKASETTIVNFLSGGEKQFIVPIYQRNYAWKKSEVEQLWININEIELEDTYNNHFLNSVIYITDGLYQTSNIPKLHIVDGQQRLTTISLLFIAIRNRLKDLKLEDSIPESERIEALYLKNMYARNENDKLKLVLSKMDNEVFRALTNNLDVQCKKNNVFTNFNILKNQVKNLTFDEIKTLISKIERVFIIDVSLEYGKDNPQLIFSSLNSAGLSLKESDLVRNFLLMNIDVSNQERLYNDYWRKIEDNFENDDLEKFIQYYLSMESGNTISKNNIFEPFISYFNTLKDSKLGEKNIENLLKKMYKFSEIYKTLFIEDLDDNSSLNRIRNFKIESYYPFLMKVYDLRKDDLLDTLKIIESYLIRRFVCSMPPNSTKNVFSQAVRNNEIKFDDDFINNFQDFMKTRTKNQRFPNNEEFATQLKIKNLYENSSSNTKYILYMLEKYINPKENVKYKSLTIEHILPQSDNDFNKLPECWKENLGEDAEHKFKTYLHSLGNLTLSGLNSELSNHCFEKKQELYKDSNVSLNREIYEKYSNWTIESILNRAEYLTQLALNVWKYL